MGQIWLRAEYKRLEKRTALIPLHAEQLIRDGHEVVVEKCSQRIFPMKMYQEAGCRMVEPGSWYQAPNHAYILGLKHLDLTQNPLKHKHIYFAHAYKHQRETRYLFERFKTGGGKLYDLEYLLNSKHQRVASFGFYAGLVGAAISLFAWCHKIKNSKKNFRIPSMYSSEMNMLTELKKQMSEIDVFPKIMLIGANGRCGLGAQCLYKEFDIKTTNWNRTHMQDPGRTGKFFSHDILLNCMGVDKDTPLLFNDPYQIINPNKKLSFIIDVSCDVESPYNPIPYYFKTTDFDDPIQDIVILKHPIQLIAIDHLPAWLPLESSIHFSNQLFPYLKQLLLSQTPWLGAEEIFVQHLENYLFNYKMEEVYDQTAKQIHYFNC